MIACLVYVSTASIAFTTPILLELLQQSRERNRSNGITGLMLYGSGNFMQALEGTDAAIQSTFARIRTDPRHHGVIALGTLNQDARPFSNWEMAFRNLTDLADDQRDEVSSFFQQVNSDSAFYAPSDHVVRRMLGRFARSIR